MLETITLIIIAINALMGPSAATQNAVPPTTQSAPGTTTSNTSTAPAPAPQIGNEGWDNG